MTLICRCVRRLTHLKSLASLVDHWVVEGKEAAALSTALDRLNILLETLSACPSDSAG